MKKTRLLAIVTLALIMSVACLTTNTFSWFTRPNISKGDALVWNNNEYNQTSTKNFQFDTYEMISEDVYSETSISSIPETSLAAGERKCYKTEIKNVGKNENQNVSLFLSGANFSDKVSTYVGVNKPMKTYKLPDPNTTSNKTVISINKKNVYVGFQKSYNLIDRTKNTFQLHYWGGTKSGDSDVNLNDDLGLHSIGSPLNSDYYVYTCAIPSDATSVKARIKNANTWFGADNGDVDKNNFVGIYIKPNSNPQTTDANYASVGTAAGIKQFYSNSTVAVGDTIDLSATGQGTITYSSSDEKIAAVNEKGIVTGKNIGSAKITVTSTGAFGDTITSECSIMVVGKSTSKIDSVSVVTNMKTMPYIEKTGENLVTVYWYIKNSSSNTVTFSVDNIDLTL